MEPNRLSVDPSSWPINWIAQEVEQQIVPPRGGGVLVSFKINAQTWPNQTMLTPLGNDGKPFPGGTLVRSDDTGELRETIINGRGQLWLGELLPASTFTITHAHRRCEFRIPVLDGETEEVTVSAHQCRDLP
jgi:outer membrane usher protein FimD/PapC